MIEDFKILDGDPDQPIELFLNSLGGDIFSSLGIIDAMGLLKSPVHTIIQGNACSCAGIISVCGKKRYITKNSYWMGHEISVSAADYLSKIKDDYHLNLSLWDMILKIYKDRTMLIDADYDKITHGELWLNSEKCLEKGIVDEILK